MDKRLHRGKVVVHRDELANGARDSPYRTVLDGGILTDATVVVGVPAAQAQEEFLWKAQGVMGRMTASLS